MRMCKYRCVFKTGAQNCGRALTPRDKKLGVREYFVFYFIFVFYTLWMLYGKAYMCALLTFREKFAHLDVNDTCLPCDRITGVSNCFYKGPFTYWVWTTAPGSRPQTLETDIWSKAIEMRCWLLTCGWNWTCVESAKHWLKQHNDSVQTNEKQLNFPNISWTKYIPTEQNSLFTDYSQGGKQDNREIPLLVLDCLYA